MKSKGKPPFILKPDFYRFFIKELFRRASLELKETDNKESYIRTGIGIAIVCLNHANNKEEMLSHLTSFVNKEWK
jgi:uncharacterized protein YlxP (DUF503 family)